MNTEEQVRAMLAKMDDVETVERKLFDLGKRATSSAHWRWVPGMAAWDALNNVERIGSDDDIKAFVFYKGGLHGFCLPCLDDPATLGCIEHGLLPGLYGDDCNLASWVAADGSTRWALEHTPDPCSSPHQRVSVSDDGHESKGEALVFALEAAP